MHNVDPVGVPHKFDEGFLGRDVFHPGGGAVRQNIDASEG
jgi:hypothetical protein